MASPNAIREAELEAQLAELEALVLARMTAAQATAPPVVEQQPPRQAAPVNEPGVEDNVGTAPNISEEDIANIQRMLLAQQLEIQMLKETQASGEAKSETPTPGRDAKPPGFKPKTLDLVVIVSCTASTRAWMDAVQSSIASLADAVKAEKPNAEIRLGFIAYPSLQTHPLTKYIDSVSEFVSSLELEGDACRPDDIVEGLKKVLDMSYQSRRKRVVLITDGSHRKHAPTMASLVNASASRGGSIPVLMDLIAKSGMDFSLIEIENTGILAAMLEAEYRRAKLVEGLENDFLRAPLTSFGGMNCLRSSAIASYNRRKPRHSVPIAKFVSVDSAARVAPAAAVTVGHQAVKQGPEPAPVSESTTKRLDWNKLIATPETEVVRHSLRVHNSDGVDVDWANPELRRVTRRVKVRLLPKPFAVGATKSAYAIFECEMEKCGVAKVYVDPAATSEARMNAEAQRHAVARKLASDFSAGFKDGSVGDGLTASWYELEGRGTSTTLFTVEPYEVKSAQSADEEREIGAKSQAFSHFTWQKTLGTLMAVDRDEVGSVFKDPLIHSIREGTFGPDDLASAGMDVFYSSHECNEICRAFGLAPLKGDDGKVKSKFVSTEEPKPKLTPPPTVSELPTPSPFIFRTCQRCGNIPRVVHTEIRGCNEKGVFCEVCATQADKPKPLHCSVCYAPMEVEAGTTVCGNCETVSRSTLPSGVEQTQVTDTSGWTVVEDLSNQPA